MGKGIVLLTLNWLIRINLFKLKSRPHCLTYRQTLKCRANNYYLQFQSKQNHPTATVIGLFSKWL